MPDRAADLDRDHKRASEIEHMLMYLGLYTRTFGCPDPMFFDDALPAYSTMFWQVVGNAGRNSREIDARAEAMSRIEGVAMFGNDRRDGGYTLIGCRPLSYHARQRLFFAGGGLLRSPAGMGSLDRDARRLMTPLTPILQVRKVEVDDGGRGVAIAPAYMARPAAMRDRWMQLVPGEMFDGDMPLAYLGFSIAVGMTATMATTWAVSLKFDPESPGLRFVTDPTGIREFFRFRDVPEGRARRAALANWVADHWRALRNSPEDEVYVRTHLRGARGFSWRGLEGSIHVPDSDTKLAEEAAARRRRMPAAEAIRRRRSHR
jgi:hypothetical protein